MTDQPIDRSYLGVVQWPDTWSEESCSALLAHAAVMDPYDASMAVKRGVPGIVAILDAPAAEQAVALLQSRGAMACALRRSTMRQIPDPIEIKRLWWNDQGPTRLLAYESWRGTPKTNQIDPTHLFLVVRARLSSTERRISSEKGLGRGGAMVGFMVGGVTGAVIGGAMGSGRSMSVSSSTRLAETIDAYFAPPGELIRLRITAGRFDASILGDQKGISPAENMPQITLMLMKANPRAILDQDFESFRIPSDIVRGHFIGAGNNAVSRTSDQPGFDFYSVWSYLFYRSLLA